MNMFLCVTVSLFSFALADVHSDEKIGCTAIAIDGAATADGSAFAGMNADSGDADNRLSFVPAKAHAKGALRPVYTFNLSYPRFVGYNRGELYHPFPGHEVLFTPVGHIEEVDSTYGYYESTEPLMNEKGLGFGESSCAAMLNNRFPDDKEDTRDVPIGLLDTVTMMQIPLERCATARCAVHLMGALADQYGFVPTPGEPTKGWVKGSIAYDDAGEAYTLADATGEAWVFHVLGGVKGIMKSVWVAQRVPKGHAAVVANQFIIGELPSEPTDDFLFNKDIFRAAKAAGLWDGHGALHFSKVFAPDEMAFESPKGASPIPLYASVRRFGVNKLLAPSDKSPFKVASLDYGFSVKVESALTQQDVFALLRTQYEGTEFDLTKGIMAGPYGNPFRSEGGPSFGQIPRGVAITRTLYSIVVQTGPSRQIAWFASDTPVTSVYVPLFSRTSAVSSSYSVGHNQEFTRDSASWAFNFVSNYMQLNYQGMSQAEVYPAIKKWQDDIDSRLSKFEAANNTQLATLQTALQEEVVASWWKLADFLVMKYNDGKVNWPKAGRSIGYPEDYAKMIGFSNDVHPIWVQGVFKPLVVVDGYTPSSVVLPQTWDSVTATWSYTRAPPMDEAARPTIAYSILIQALVTSLAVGFGIAIGRSYESRKASRQDAYLLLN